MSAHSTPCMSGFSKKSLVRNEDAVHFRGGERSLNEYVIHVNAVFGMLALENLLVCCKAGTKIVFSQMTKSRLIVNVYF